MKVIIKTELEIEITLDIAKDVKDISVLGLRIIQSDLIQRLSDGIAKYSFEDKVINSYDPMVIRGTIKTGSAKTEMLI